MRRFLIAMVFVATLWPSAAEAGLKPGDPVYDAIAKRITIPSEPNVEVVVKMPRVGGGPNQWLELRNIPILGAVIRWAEKYPVVDAGVILYKPSENTLGSVATLERTLRKTSMREPASAAGVTEEHPGGPRRDVWCPPKNDRTSGLHAIVLDIALVDGLPALTLSEPRAEQNPECQS
jgi:hypothetical protein